MPTDEMSTMDLIEANEKALYEHLGRVNYDDASRGKLLEEAKVYAGIRKTYGELEQTKLDSESKNQLDVRRMIIEEEKVKNEKKRIGVDVGKAALYFFGGMFSGFSSYMLDTWFQEYKPLKRLQEKAHDALIKK